jgi:hypothetical protein
MLEVTAQVANTKARALVDREDSIQDFGGRAECPTGITWIRRSDVTRKVTFVILLPNCEADYHSAIGGVEMSSPMNRRVNTRRWSRHPVELPVRVFPRGGDSKLTVQGRGIEMSEGGMTLYAGVPLKPGDLMDLEFQMPAGTRVAAIVRNRTGFCFGLEFLTPLGSEKAKPVVAEPAASNGNDLRTVLRRKELEIERLRKEIATLRTFGKYTP